MRVAPGIYRAESRGEVIYALDCGGAHALVDVGSADGFAAKLQQLQTDGIDLERIAAVFITHSHLDHSGALCELRGQQSLRVVAHRLAVEQLRHCPAHIPIDHNLVDYTVDERDAIEIGDLVIHAHHVPGHTSDSIAWQFNNDFFVGDLLRCDGRIGWMDAHWGSCVADYRNSLHRLLRMKIENIFPGRGEQGPFSQEIVEEALRRLNALCEADGGLLTATGRPAPRRSVETPAKTIRLSTGSPTSS